MGFTPWQMALLAVFKLTTTFQYDFYRVDIILLTRESCMDFTVSSPFGSSTFLTFNETKLLFPVWYYPRWQCRVLFLGGERRRRHRPMKNTWSYQMDFRLIWPVIVVFVPMRFFPLDFLIAIIVFCVIRVHFENFPWFRNFRKKTHDATLRYFPLRICLHLSVSPSSTARFLKKGKKERDQKSR